MAARIGFSLATLSRLDPAACKADARLVWKDGDEFNIGIVQPRMIGNNNFIQGLHVANARELRLLGDQMRRHADDLERSCRDDEFEVVLP